MITMADPGAAVRRLSGRCPEEPAALGFDLGVVVEDHVEQRAMDFNFPVIVDEPQPPKLVHEEVDA